MNSLSKFLAIALLTVAVPMIALPLPAASNSANPAQQALQTLLTEPSTPLPAGTKLNSITLADGLATVNFSHELRDNFRGGDTEEANTVNAVLKTLGVFPTINRVQILVEGSPIDSLGGLISMTDPLPVIRAASPGEQPIRRFHRKPRR